MNGVELIAAERERQKTVEGWSADHDAAHADGSLARAAACYALSSAKGLTPHAVAGHIHGLWPWSQRWWKPKTPIRDLARAGALIAAEIDRRIDKGDKP